MRSPDRFRAGPLGVAAGFCAVLGVSLASPSGVSAAPPRPSTLAASSPVTTIQFGSLFGGNPAEGSSSGGEATSGDSEWPNCPNVLITDGGAAIKQGANQISIANVARECILRRDGKVVIKVGVEGRALAGPGSSGGRFDVPLTVSITVGDTVLLTKSRRVSVAIPSGQAQASFTAVEGDLVLPPGTGDFDIFVGLGNSRGGTAKPAGSRRGRG